MPIIRALPEQHICDVCDGDAGVRRSDYPERNLVICDDCNMRGKLWACRKALEEHRAVNPVNDKSRR